MRLRRIKGADEAVEQNPYCVSSPAELKGKWHALFENNNPIHIEIGMGKGRFIMTLAETFSDVNYIGMERYTSVLFRALQKAEQNPMPNLRFLCQDAARLPEFFAPGEIDRIYLNFSDPWPKDRHAKRRLTSRQFLALYQKILKNDGMIEFKTDNVDLFDFSLEEVTEAGWRLVAFTRDLHHDETMNQGNIMTEYEQRFSAKGNPIHKLIASQST